MANEGGSNTSMFRRGVGLDKVHDLLSIVFSSQAEDFRTRVGKCYKVYVEHEQPKPTRGAKTNESGWIQPKATIAKQKSTAKVISYWCFSPGFG